MMRVLNEYQIQHFRNTGYLILDKKIPAKTVDKIIASVNEEISLRKRPFRMYKNGKIFRLDGLYRRRKSFRDLITHPYIIKPLTSLLGTNIEFVANRHNHATINKSTEKRFHRDILQWSRSLVTVIIYLEPSNIQNGCTQIIPSSQFLPCSGKPNNGGTWLDEDSKYSKLISQALPIPMGKGGILLFDSLTFHSVGENFSNTTRMSITLGYHSVDELSGKSMVNKILVHGSRIYRGNI